jgi:iron complex transport system substrate-binding protein
VEIKRIVSFLPSATELLYELGAQDKIYGVTHECLYPKEAQSKPRVITAVFDPINMNSKEIDETTTRLVRTGNDIFMLDEKNLLSANPDLIISQNTCEVCAAYSNQVNKALQILQKPPRLHSMDPHNVKEILKTISDLAELIGENKKGAKLKQSLEKRIEYIKNHYLKNRITVLALEWLEPFFTSGHWIPEMIEIAGGKNLISKAGEHSRRLSFDEIEQADPEMIILMPCGFDLHKTISEYKNILEKNTKWQKLKAVAQNNVYAVDANSYFSKPSIRTIIGIEILAKIIHPEIFEKLPVPPDSYKQIKSK